MVRLIHPTSPFLQTPLSIYHEINQTHSLLSPHPSPSPLSVHSPPNTPDSLRTENHRYRDYSVPHPKADTPPTLASHRLKAVQNFLPRRIQIHLPSGVEPEKTDSSTHSRYWLRQPWTLGPNHNKNLSLHPYSPKAFCNQALLRHPEHNFPPPRLRSDHQLSSDYHQTTFSPAYRRTLTFPHSLSCRWLPSENSLSPLQPLPGQTLLFGFPQPPLLSASPISLWPVSFQSFPASLYRPCYSFARS